MPGYFLELEQQGDYQFHPKTGISGLATNLGKLTLGTSRILVTNQFWSLLLSKYHPDPNKYLTLDGVKTLF